MKASESWSRLRAHRLAYTLMILITLAVGILIGTLVSINVKGKEGQKTASSDARDFEIAALDEAGRAQVQCFDTRGDCNVQRRLCPSMRESRPSLQGPGIPMRCQTGILGLQEKSR